LSYNYPLIVSREVSKADISKVKGSFCFRYC